MDKLSVLIVDADPKWCDDLRYQVAQCPQFNVMEPVHCGGEAFALIKANKPDVILLDLIIPFYDGLYIIDFITGNMPTYRPVIYVLSTMVTPTVIRVLNDYVTVKFYNIKPVRPEAVLSNLRRFVAEEPVLATSAATTQLDSDSNGQTDFHKPGRAGRYSQGVEAYLQKLGLDAFAITTRCTHIAIERYIMLDESRRIRMEELYEQVGQTFTPALSSAAVQRNIRTAVIKVNELRTSHFDECFPYSFNSFGAGAFVRKSANILKRWILENGNDKISVGKDRTIPSE